MSKDEMKEFPILEAIEDRILGVPIQVKVVSKGGIICDT